MTVQMTADNLNILENHQYTLFSFKNCNRESYMPKEGERVLHYDNAAAHMCVSPLVLGSKFHHNASPPPNQQI